MPQYEYTCPNDGKTFEMVASYEDNISCPDCGYTMVRQFPTRTPKIVFGSTGGASLVDTYEQDFKQMELDGEL